MINYLAAAREAQPAARRLLLAWGLLCFASYGVGGVVPTLYLLRLGYDARFLGLMGGLGGLAYAAVALPAGWLGARLGQRRLLVSGLSLIMLGYLVVPLGEFLPPDIRGTVILSVVTLINVGFSLFVVNQVPFLMAATGSQERNHVFSLQSALLPLTAFSGSLLGGLLPGLFAALTGDSLDAAGPFRWSTFCIAALMLPSVFAMISAPEPGEVPQSAPTLTAGRGAPWRLIALMSILAGLRVVSPTGLGSFYTIYLDTSLGLAPSGIGTLVGIGRLAAGVLVLSMPGLAARWGSRRTVVISSAAAALSLILLAAWPTLPGATLGFVGVTAFLAAGEPSFAIYRQLLVARNWRTLMSGANNMVSSVLGAAVTYGGGLLITARGFAPFFMLCAGFTALAAGLMAGAAHPVGASPSEGHETRPSP